MRKDYSAFFKARGVRLAAGAERELMLKKIAAATAHQCNASYMHRGITLYCVLARGHRCPHHDARGRWK